MFPSSWNCDALRGEENSGDCKAFWALPLTQRKNSGHYYRWAFGKSLIIFLTEMSGFPLRKRLHGNGWEGVRRPQRAARLLRWGKLDCEFFLALANSACTTVELCWPQRTPGKGHQVIFPQLEDWLCKWQCVEINVILEKEWALLAYNHYLFCISLVACIIIQFKIKLSSFPCSKFRQNTQTRFIPETQRMWFYKNSQLLPSGRIFTLHKPSDVPYTR